MTEYRKTTWTNAQVIPIGGSWAYAVGRIDGGSIRIAKGKLLPVPDAESHCPISQGQKVNIKRAREWDQIKAAVDALFAEQQEATT